uniref:NADH-ubiquinone oxidoreductase chain 6 n=1 Tax=Atractomorpha psittacina TaxID=1920482 RepID=A0A6G6A6H8_9ORTH|nr:NADH dehydrogenase subunit 6 [Atractomorpha psittacina]YP_010987353.1 NADH dehydrogenase subunit 6 [Atractomorpha lata]QID03860.1 NADH dehydrogenase subunit 6 [Atractomorpha psittacina]WOL43054.1 NADH dehydrogenase subunit 6 [Atractomorpha lata]
MFSLFISALSNSMNLYFIKINHPMSMMMIIIYQTLFIGLMTGNFMESFWISYILILTFLGGMLVIFVYISSIASNELFNLNLNKTMMFGFITMSIFMSLIIVEYIMISDIFKNKETSSMNLSIDIMESTSSLTKIYNYPSFMITIMMMVYLLLTLIVVVYITNINKGPIRKIN